MWGLAKFNIQGAMNIIVLQDLIQQLLEGDTSKVFEIARTPSLMVWRTFEGGNVSIWAYIWSALDSFTMLDGIEKEMQISLNKNDIMKNIKITDLRIQFQAIGTKYRPLIHKDLTIKEYMLTCHNFWFEVLTLTK